MTNLMVSVITGGGGGGPLIMLTLDPITCTPSGYQYTNAIKTKCPINKTVH